MIWKVDFQKTFDKDRIRWIKETLRAQNLHESQKHGEAVGVLWEILIETRHALDPEWECATMVHMSYIYRVIRGQIAVKLLEQALKLADDIGFSLGKMMALNELGAIECLWGKLDKAEGALAQALDLVRPNDEDSRRQILINLSIVYEGKGEKGKLRDTLEEVIAIDGKLGLPDAEDREHLERISRSL